jgi:cell division protease FtsH
LGGRVSEELVFDEISTGAQNDLEVASQIARRMVCEFGMSKKLGHLTLGHRRDNIFLGRDIAEVKNYSDETARLIDSEVKSIIDEAYLRARSLLSHHKEELKKLAEKLKEDEILYGEQVKQLVGLGNNESKDSNT